MHSAPPRIAAALVLGGLIALAGCEGLFSGTRESVQPLNQHWDGAFEPVRLNLTPDMNPIAFNLKGTTVARPEEGRRWNAYQAVLSLDGAQVASGRFNVNNPGTREDPQGGDFATTMLYASVPRTGTYELVIQPLKPKEITIESPQLEVRRQVELPPSTPGR
jgi:hypothetical protein